MSLAEQIAPRSRIAVPRLIAPLVVLAAGLTATALAVFQLYSLVEQAERERFESVVTQRADAIADRVETYVAVLRGVAGLFAAAEQVTAAEFAAYFNGLRVSELYPGMSGIGFAQVVTPEEREALIARMHAEGRENFKIWPEGERPVVTSIIYLEPRDIRNEAAIGFDMYSEPTRRAAMEAARDQGAGAASGRVVLVQELGESQQPGFLIYVPIYDAPDGQIPETVDARRQSIIGWAYAPFRAHDLLTRAIGLRDRNRETEFTIYDGVEERNDNILYKSGDDRGGLYAATRQIDVAGRAWTVSVRSTDDFVPDSNRAIIPFVLAGGLLTTLLLFGASYSQARATANAEDAREQLREANATLEDRVEERTAQLESARAALETLNRNLEIIVDARTSDLQAANEEIQRFAYIVSHDLRSPLVNVMGFTSELQVAREAISKFYDDVVDKLPDADNPEVRLAIEAELPEAIEFIRSSTAKMDRLINAILRLSREGARVLTPEPIALKTLLETTGQTLAHQVAEAGAQLVVEDVPDIVSDRLAVEQVFTNLLENAVKYLAPGRPGRIRVRGWQEGSTVFVDVEDNGRGIDPKDHSRVFDLFRRAGTQDKPGEGIGLAHVRALVRRLGGTVTLNSAPGEGATFRVSLPRVLATGKGDE